jgi:peroxiredoxin
MPIQPGQPAPDATLVNLDRQEVSISDYKGQNVVLLFFPFAFTGVCTAELCAVRDDIASYQGLNAQVLGVSVDSPFTLARFREEQQLNFPLLSDFNKGAIAAYDCRYESFVAGLQPS